MELPEINHDFRKTNGYPNWVFNQIHQKVIKSREISTKKLNSTEDSATEGIAIDNTKKVHIILSYKGEKGQNLMKSLNDTLSNALYDRHVLKFCIQERN